MTELDEELQGSLKDIVTLCEKEDDEIRKAQVRMWKKNEEFWHGVQYLFWSERDETWVSPLDVTWRSQFTEEELHELGPFYDYVVDIFKAHGESIISALSAQIPSLRFIPDDADDQADVITAKTYSKIADLVCRHNKAKLVYMRALFYQYINGIVFAYVYKDTDPRYGTREVPQYSTETRRVDYLTCSNCGYVRDANEQQCPQCGAAEADYTPQFEEVPVQTGTVAVPKTRVKIDVFGGLNVKVPYYARRQEDCNYLILSTDQPKSLVQSVFPDKADKIEAEHISNMERFARSQYSYESGSEPEQKHLVTVIKAWLRPSEFWREKDEAKRKKLQQKFPKGCRVTLVGKNKVFISAEDEDLDDRWVIGQAGLSTYIHSDPICRPLVPIQELRNQLVNLTMDTIEHGIPATFADKEVLDFDAYGKFEAAPGFIFPVKMRGNRPVSEHFFTEPKATFPREVPGFIRNLDQDAQFATGSFPSIYGGPSEGKSRTYSEYAASRQMALQRLSICNMLTTDWWMRTMELAVRTFADLVIDDERYVEFDSGSYVNVWIRRSELSGKVGGVEPETSDAFPVSLVQKRDLIMRLIELNNQYLNTALYSPDNVSILADVLALTDLKLPGEDQRVKQVIEINDLRKEGPVDEITPTVLPEPEVDDDAVHIEVLRNFLVSSAGLDLKRTNPPGYANCVAHLRLHLQSLQLKSIQQFGGSPPGVEPETTAVEE